MSHSHRIHFHYDTAFSSLLFSSLEIARTAACSVLLRLTIDAGKQINLSYGDVTDCNH